MDTRTATIGAHAPAVLALSAGAALILGWVTAAPAWAHDSLIGSTPEAGDVLEDSPEEVVLEFSGDGLITGENVPNTIWVTDAEGQQWHGETDVDGPTMRTELPEPLPDGEYEVLYNAVYSDGHSEELSFNFEVDGADVDQDEDASAPAETAEQPTPSQTAEQSPSEEQTAEGSGNQQTEAAEQDTAETQAAGADASAEGENSQFPVWTAVGIGAGLLLLIAAGLLLVRRRLNQTGQE